MRKAQIKFSYAAWVTELRDVFAPNTLPAGSKLQTSVNNVVVCWGYYAAEKQPTGTGEVEEVRCVKLYYCSDDEMSLSLLMLYTEDQRCILHANGVNDRMVLGDCIEQLLPFYYFLEVDPDDPESKLVLTYSHGPNRKSFTPKAFMSLHDQIKDFTTWTRKIG